MRQQLAQKNAFTTLLKEDPQNELVKDDEQGNPVEFDPNTDYKTPLAAVLRTKAAAAAETAKHADQLDTLQKTADLRDWVGQQQKAIKAAHGRTWATSR